MKRSVKYFIITFYFFTLFSSCEREHTSTQLNPFYKMKVNGKLETINACGSSDHVAQFLRDTAVFAGFGCDGQRAGFYLRGRIVDGTYFLDSKNVAWYDIGTTSYHTDSLNKGTITIKSGNFQALGGLIPFVEGSFSFDAVEKNTGQKIKVTGGKYLLKKFQY